MQNQINEGANKIIHYDNIAIVVLFICLLLAVSFNVLQWHQRNKNDQMMMKALGAMKDALVDLKVTIAVLNERIGHK